MEGNINHEFIVAYAKKAAHILIDKHFKKSMMVKGDDILHFSDLKQINFFVLKILFEKWKTEFDNLKSPFFDYKSQDVLLAARKFMNVLSKNILIEKEDFRPLLEEAIYKTVLLIFSPYEYYLQEINKPEFRQISIMDLTDLQKYVKINSHLLQAYIGKFHNDGIQAVFNDDAVRLFDEVCENIKETPEEFDVYHKSLNEIEPLDINALYAQTSETSQPNEQPPTPQKPSSENLNEKFKSSQKTLLDTFEKEKKEALIDIHEKKPIEGIKKSITIYQRFMFERDLFKGDKDEFEMVINYLDNCTSKKEALDFIEDNYTVKKKWDKSKEEVREFFQIIEKRFPA